MLLNKKQVLKFKLVFSLLEYSDLNVMYANSTRFETGRGNDLLDIKRII